MKARSQSLDVLRAVAVLMVIVHHYAPEGPSLLHLGALGVDLFFVLSGFLIAGLLFAELKGTGTISLRRFYVRRGLKIYPAFYFFLVATYPLSPRLSASHFLSEALFLQSYIPHIWQHTWSLSVEELFYLALPIMLVALHRFRRLELLPVMILLIAISCLLLRSRIPVEHFNHAHLRADALFAGVALAYCQHFHPRVFELVSKTRLLLPCGLMLSFIPQLTLLRASGFLAAAAPTCAFFGFGLLLWRFQGMRIQVPWLAMIGRYSYSIYLWHMPIAMFWAISLPMNALGMLSDIVTTLLLGIGMALMIEQPGLHLRDRMFPPWNRSVEELLTANQSHGLSAQSPR